MFTTPPRNQKINTITLRTKEILLVLILLDEVKLSVINF
jgi:hypothetical protein